MYKRQVYQKVYITFLCGCPLSDGTEQDSTGDPILLKDRRKGNLRITNRPDPVSYTHLDVYKRQGITMWALVICIFIITFGRMIEIYLVTSVALSLIHIFGRRKRDRPRWTSRTPP